MNIIINVLVDVLIGISLAVYCYFLIHIIYKAMEFCLNSLKQTKKNKSNLKQYQKTKKESELLKSENESLLKTYQVLVDWYKRHNFPIVIPTEKQVEDKIKNKKQFFKKSNKNRK